MKSRFNIYNSMERAFLALQTQIKKLKQGSVIRALLYSVSNELENAYGEIDEVKRNMYIDTATGDYLDSLVEGFVALPRRDATYASGYVVVELGEEITAANLDLLTFSFAHFDKINNTVNFDYTGTIKIDITKDDRTLSYYVCQPQSFDLTTTQFENDPVVGEQRLLSSYKEYLSNVYTTTGKGIKKLILPVVSAEPGQTRNLQAETIEFIGNIGMPIVVKNVFYVDTANSYSIADVDGVLSLPQGSTDPISNANLNYRVLGDYAYIAGGANTESDGDYRDRYYLYLDSLSRGTLASLEFAVKTYIPNVKVKAIEAGVPGIVTVYVDSPQVISKNLLSKVNEIIRDFRSAGILVNLRPTRVEFLNVLVDLDSDSLESATERARSIVGSAFEGKNLASTVSYTELHELLDLGEIRKTDNIYYGSHLSPELYNLYKDTINDVVSSMSADFSVLPSPTYTDLLNTVMDGNVALFDNANPDIKYPLVQLVRKAKEMDPTLIDDPALRNIVERIQHPTEGCGKLSRAGVCMEKMQNDLPPGEVLIIKISDLEELVGKWYSNYYKIKMLTVPPVRSLKSDEAVDLIEMFMYNDVINLSYDDLIEVDVGEFSKVRLAKNFVVNEKLYKINSLVGTRKIER